MSDINVESAAGNVCHCGKRFLRREHLRRHQATHREPSFVCPVCQYSFTRSDLLRRHAARHGSEIVLEPRVRRACHACHSSKTRCDGGTPCLSCTKKGIECLYSHLPPVSTRAPADISGVAAQELSSSSGLSVHSAQNQPDDRSDLSSPSIGTDNVVTSMHESQDDMLSAGTRGMRSVLGVLNTSSHSSLDELFEESSSDVRAWSMACMEAYLGHFHAHWPIIHSPTFDFNRDPLMVSASVLMIGHWLTCTESDAELIIAVHEKLVDTFLKELGAGSKPDQPWQIEEYQAVLLNIIFAFCSKYEQVITRATMLLSLFVTSLRQIGFFSSEMAAYQEQTHFPGTFLPFVLCNREKRTRLVTSLFKIDTCFSLISGQGPHLQAEELDVDLPSTFAIWNAHPLPEFHKRFPQEPTARAGIRLFEFYRRPELLDPAAWLVVDVQFGLCAMYREVWRFNMMRRNDGDTEPHSKAQLAKQLGFWKAQLDRVSPMSDAQWSQADNGNFSLKFYQGWEPEGSPSTLARYRSLVYDATMLYYAVGLNLYSGQHILKRFVRSPAALVAEIPASAHNQMHNARIREWSLSADGRKALSFGIAALEAQEKILLQDKSRSRSAEPLADVALSNSAAALSAWFESTEGSCNCGIAAGLTGPVDPEGWSNDGSSLAVGHDWLCVCRADAWRRRFAAAQAGLPQQ